MAFCPVDAHLLQLHMHSILTHTHKATHFVIFPRFQPQTKKYRVISGSPRLLLWQVVDILFPKHSPHIRQGHGLLKTYVSHCPGQCQQRATWLLTRSSGRCYHDTRKSPQLTCPSTSHPLCRCLVPQIKHSHLHSVQDKRKHKKRRGWGRVWRA